MRPIAAVLVALLLGGCNAGEDPTVEAGPGTSAETPAPGPETPSTPVGGGAPPISAPATSQRAHLTEVRVLPSPGEGGGARVVFEFAGAVPGYRIDYVERPVTEDGSGDEVAVQGEALLEVRMENASGARLEGERAVRTYTGPRRVAAADGGAVLSEAVAVGDFEGAVTWVLGLTRRVPEVTVTTAADPPQLIIDVPAGG